MQLTSFTDYSLRVLIYLGHKGGSSTIQEIATGFGISKNHLVKVVHRMSTLGLLNSAKGVKGGVSLAKEAQLYKVGELIEMMEPNMKIVECFDPQTNTCPIIGVCDLEKILAKAKVDFINALNQYTLKDLLTSKNGPEKMRRLGIK